MKRHWPALACLALYWVALAVLMALSVRRTGGLLIYPLDDAYIHMAMAKNAAAYPATPSRTWPPMIAWWRPSAACPTATTATRSKKSSSRVTVR